MTGVLNHKADVVFSGKVNGSHNIGARRNIDGVIGEVAQRAGLALRSEGVASLVGKEHLHHRGGGRQARNIVSVRSGERGV